MSSLTTELDHYELAQSLLIHGGSVRSISVHNAQLLSGGFDNAMYLCTHSGDGKYELTAQMTDSTSYIYSTCFDSDGTHAYGGTQDGRIACWDFSSTNWLSGHDSVVNCVQTQGNTLLSGSWDATARLWDLETCVVTKVLNEDKHNHAVVATFTPQGIWTGSQNGNINLWSPQGQFIKTIRAHDDIVRQFTVVENLGVLSCSNDCTVKLWGFDGTLLQQASGHSGFIFCNTVLPTGEWITGSDDKTAKIWRNGEPVDNLDHTNTVWDIKANNMGDIITAGADCGIRVFTKEETRLASVEERKTYVEECEASNVTDTSNPAGIDTANLPSVEEIPFVQGVKEGEIKVFNNNGVPEAFSWHVEGAFWERIGEVVDGPEGQGNSQSGSGGSSNFYPGGRFLPAGTYEYVFKVDTGDGFERQLPFNSHQNPLEVAEKFIAQEGLYKDSLNQITQFIRTNANIRTPAQQAAAVKPTTNKYFPYLFHYYFEQLNLDKIAQKIKEFAETVPEELKISERELLSLDRIVQLLSAPNTYHNTEIYTGEFDLIKKLITWPKDKIFPILDLFRVFILHPHSQELFKGSDYGANYTGVFLSTLMNAQDPPSLITSARVLANMFKHSVGQFCMKRRRSAVVESCIPHLANGNKLVRQGVAVILLNYSVLFCVDDDAEGRLEILQIASKMITTEVEPETLLRLYVTVGNLMIGGGSKTPVIQAAKAAGLQGTIASKGVADPKITECGGFLTAILA